MYLITKLQNLKAIHNKGDKGDKGDTVVSNYKITKSESYSQQAVVPILIDIVVSNYKITKSESYSQLLTVECENGYGCI